MKKAALDEVLRIVRDEEPPRPSQRLSTSQMKASIAATRQSDPVKLSQLMQGEIDWIVMKALEKDRTRRYDTANGLASDVQRYLSGEQVQAVPPSLGYRLKKAYRRNKTAVWVVMAFAGLLLTGVTASTVLAIQARRAEAMAEAKRVETEEQRQEAEENKNAWLKVSEVYWEAAVEAEIRGVSARLDADLLEYKADARVGLLRLSRPLNDSVKTPSIGPNFSGRTFTTFKKNPEFVKLREFQTAAVISAGQEYVPLVPPLNEGDVSETSPDGRLHLTGRERMGIELTAIPSLKRIGVLREANERLVKWGFSPDSQTVWTLDTDSISRFWNTDGTFRAKTPLWPERFMYPAGLRWGGVAKLASGVQSILVSDRVAVLISFEPLVSPGGEVEGFNPTERPVDLYSTRTGQFIRRLDRPAGSTLLDFRLEASNRWLIYQEWKERERELVIVSAEDGRELARIDRGPISSRYDVCVSPSGKWALTIQSNSVDKVQPDQVKLWRSSDWQQVDDAALREVVTRFGMASLSRFITDDVFCLYYDEGAIEASSMVYFWKPGEEFRGKSLYTESRFHSLQSELGGTLIRYGRVLTDANTLQRLKPPVGRRYAAELAKLAPDGRFFENLDTVTEKEFPLLEYYLFTSHFPNYGQVGWNRYEQRETRTDHHLVILPDPSKLNIPPAILELWAQVVTGGELGVDGRFEAWDEPTWQAKQKELAAMEPPYKDFPFPGWVATEPHLWWRIRAYMTQNYDERNKLLEEWRDRSGRSRLETEPDTWRTLGPAQTIEEPQPTTSEGSSVSDAPNTQP